MVDSVKDIDKNKIAILLSETQEIAFHISLYFYSTTFLSCNFISNVNLNTKVYSLSDRNL